MKYKTSLIHLTSYASTCLKEPATTVWYYSVMNLMTLICDFLCLESLLGSLSRLPCSTLQLPFLHLANWQNLTFACSWMRWAFQVEFPFDSWQNMRNIDGFPSQIHSAQFIKVISSVLGLFLISQKCVSNAQSGRASCLSLQLMLETQLPFSPSVTTSFRTFPRHDVYFSEPSFVN